MSARQHRSLSFAFVLALVACGGSAPKVQNATGPRAADPRAVEKYVAATKLLEPPAKQAARSDKRDDSRAVTLLEEALALDPHLWEARHDLGVLYRQRGDTLRALEELEHAHETAPAANEPLLALAEAEHALGNRERATELLQAYAERSPRSVSARVALSALHRESGAYDLALAQAREALLLSAGETTSQLDALLEIGRVYRAKSELDVADLVFQKAAALDAKSPRPPNELGLSAVARGDTQLAFQKFEAALALDGAFAPARLNRAVVLLRAGSYERAAAEYRKVLEQDESHAAAHVGLGIALRGLGKHEEAAAEYEKVLRTTPNHVAALFDLAIVQSEHLSKPKEAAERFKQFLDVAPDGPARDFAQRAIEQAHASEAQP